MCGLTGYINNEVKNEVVIKEMSEAIIHRGPDSEGYYKDKKINMAFRRLAIIDIKSGNQPIYNETKDKIIMFNGEIYNYKEVRDVLEKKGHVFNTKTDTEVILHGYEEFGKNILSMLRGMFAFVIWDKLDESLFLARDMFGIKPLYYSLMNDTFMFSSEIKSILKCPYYEKKLNDKVLKTYLTFQYNPMEETFFKGIFKLLPGHSILYKAGKIKINKYFDYDITNELNSENDAIKRLEKTIHESVEYHKVSDIEVGAFLSGGIDSSYIVSLLKPNKTFTVGFKEKGFNEIEDAKRLSKILNINNKSKLIEPDEFFEALPKVQYFSDEPHANLSSVPLYFLSKLAKKDVNVVLSGEGADELFAGYGEYKQSNLLYKYKRLPKKFRVFIKNIVKCLPDIKGKNFLIKGASEVSDYYIGPSMIFTDKEANKIVKSKYKTDIKCTDITKPFYEKTKNLDDITRMQHLDINVWLPNDILLKADKMTMASSLELRVPFLDKEVFDLSCRLDKKLKIKDNTYKYILRKCSMNVIPKEWSKRNKKGFLVPFKEYIREEKYYNIIKKEFESDYAKEFFDTEKLIKLLDIHYSGKKETHRKIYTVYSFLIWYKQYFINS